MVNGNYWSLSGVEVPSNQGINVYNPASDGDDGVDSPPFQGGVAKPGWFVLATVFENSPIMGTSTPLSDRDSPRKGGEFE